MARLLERRAPPPAPLPAPPAAQIGGVEAPTPVGELGHTLMTQALELSEVHWEPSGVDMLCTGYLPASGGLLDLFLRWRDGGGSRAGLN